MMLMIMKLLFFLILGSQSNDIYLCIQGALIPASPFHDLSTLQLDHLPLIRVAFVQCVGLRIRED